MFLILNHFGLLILTAKVGEVQFYLFLWPTSTSELTFEHQMGCAGWLITVGCQALFTTNLHIKLG